MTGGAGFIGSHLVRLLRSEGHNVRILDALTSQVHGAVPKDLGWLEESGVDVLRGSVTSRADWQRALEGIDIVVHLAAETGTGQSMYELEKYCTVNMVGTGILFELLAGARGSGVKRVILSSSRSVYGEGAFSCTHCGFRGTPDPRPATQLQKHEWEPFCPSCKNHLQPVPTTESDAIRPASIYAATKYAQEDLVRISCEALNIGYSILRFQNVYGEGQSLQNPYTGILSIFSTKIRRGLELPIFEDGQETRDFVHVSDVVDALYKSILAPSTQRGIYNVGSGVGTSIEALAIAQCKAFGTEPKLKVTGQFRVGDIRHNVADLTHIGADLGYKSKVSLEDGLRRFASWVLSQPLPEDRLAQANQELIDRKLMG